MPEGHPACEVPGVPAYLHQFGRAADPVFADEERLFVRFKLDAPQIKNVISFQRQSCNRERYCEGGADDVLVNTEHGGRHDGYGVVAITVAAVRGRRAEIEEPGSRRVYTLLPEHQLNVCNCPHAEIVAQLNGQPDADHIKPASMKKRLREQLVEQCTVVLPMERAGERLEGR